MILGRFNNWIVLIIILCSTSLYKVSALGNLQEVAELVGIGLMAILIIIHQAYAQGKPIRKNFLLPISLIILSIFTSMVMANFSRNQPFGQTIFAQRAMYYYLFYFLLHQLKVKPKDLEWIFIALGIFYIGIYLLQFSVFPRILFDGYVRSSRGTIRIYLPGFSYMVIAFFFGIQYFFRTNKFKHFLLVLLTAIIFVLIGGRQTLAIVILITVIFLIVDKKIKSRFFIGFLGLVGVVAIFLIFQGVFEAIILESRSDANLGDDYIRLKTAEYFLTDFFKSPFAYITGNGMYFNTSAYGKEIGYNMVHNHFVIGDIGIIGNYAFYGAFFLTGVFIICYRALKLKIETGYTYIKLMFANIILSMILGGGFTNAGFICNVVLMLYMIDVSSSEVDIQASKNKQIV
jgi:hypothetical protein